jgi:hypothetical protein|nr:hypothetical protein [Neorhizobium sp. T6_25]
MASVENIGNEPIGNLVARMETMTEEEIFITMRQLEFASEAAREEDRDNILARIALVESEIERRYPGQVLAPYREWMRRGIVR